jgi:uncharacterized surface protein with fasciclin (FAS1) repeats
MSTVLEIAYADKSLSSIMKGLKAANLEEPLNGIDPFTVQPPVNLAFGNLIPTDTFENMVKQSNNNSKFSNLLTYHVVTGKKLLRNFRNGQQLQQVNGKELAVTILDGIVRKNGTKKLVKDRQGSNGVVHSIDIVNLPSA